MRPSSDLPRRRLAVPGRRGRNIALGVLAGLVIGIVVARWLARLVTDGWWFDVLDQRPVLSTINRARFELGLVGGLLAAVVLYACLFVVDRTAPLEQGYVADDELVLRYQVLVAEHGLLVRLTASGLFGLIAGLPLAARWQEWLLFRHAVSFDVPDQVYDYDVGFFVFRLPFLLYAVEWLFSVLLVAALVSAAAHYLSGSVRLAAPRRAAAGVRLHLTLLLVALALVRAGAYWLRRLDLVTSTRGFVRGVGYTDANHVQPALLLLILVALTTAVLLVVGLRQRSWRLPMVATALWAVVALMATTVYPAVVQRIVADDEPAQREQSAIERNLVATRAAFGLDDETLRRPDTVVASPSEVTGDDLVNLGDVRLLSAAAAARAMDVPAAGGLPAPPMGTRPDVGLYVFDGEARQVFVGVPAVDPGDGVPWDQRHRRDISAAAPFLIEASRVDADGGVVEPDRSAPVHADVSPIVVGEEAGSFAIVSPASQPRPAPAVAAVPLSSFARRAAFALRFADLELIQRTDGDDRILYVRSVADRVRTLAPFLSWDSDPYAVVADGRVKWVVDGYTTTDAYPAAERADVTGVPAASGLPIQFNYVRNSVKAVVDAHEGRITLYVTDETDPILSAWQGAFPGLFETYDRLSSQVKAQLRYPNDLLRVQATMWGRYRTDDLRGDDARVFADDEGRWATAPTRVTGAPLVSAATSSTSAARAATSTTVRATTTGAAGTSSPDPVLVVWGDRLVSTVALVAAERPNLQRELAALVTGTVGVDGRPLLRVLRSDGSLPSPGAARVQLEDAVRGLDAKLDPDLDFGELQPVEVGRTLAWVLPWYGTAGSTVAGVALLADGRVSLGHSVEAAARALYRVDPGFTTKQPGGSGKDPTVIPPAGEKTAAELWSEVRDLRAQADAKLRANDPTGAIQLLEQALDRAEQARLAEESERAGATTTTVSPVTTSTVPTVDA